MKRQLPNTIYGLKYIRRKKARLCCQPNINRKDPCLDKPLDPWLKPGKTLFRTQVASHHKLWHSIRTYLGSTGIL